jgi:hypothetical protein
VSTLPSLLLPLTVAPMPNRRSSRLDGSTISRAYTAPPAWCPPPDISTS